MSSSIDNWDPKLPLILFYQLEETMKAAIRYTHRRFAEANVDLTKDQFLVLKKVIDELDGVTPREIAQALFKEAASVSRTLDILIKKDLLRRIPHPSDRRSHLITASAQGLKAYQAVLPIVQSIRRQAISGFSDAEVISLRKTLERMRNNLK